MQVAIIKYNAGNVRSVDCALRRLGVEAMLTDDEAVLRKADRVIFPGVGEAGTTMDFLRNTGLDSVIRSLEKPVLVGHSMGGGLALAVAADRPDLLKSVVVVDALPCLSALYNPGFQSQAEVDCTGVVQQLMAQDDAQFARQQRLSAANLTTDSLLCERLVQWGTSSDRRTYAQMYCDYSNTDMRPLLGRIKVPAFVLLEPSFQRMAPMVEEQFKGLRTVRLEYATRGLHFIMRDDCDWFIGQLKGFLGE